MKFNNSEKIKLKGIEDLLGLGNEEISAEIPIGEIQLFRGHPFKVLDDEATIVMVDANVQREEILPSERAYALRMKHEAIKRQGKRTDITSNQNDWKLENSDTSNQVGWKSETAALIGKDAGISIAQVRRYIRLTHLLPELLDLVDRKKLKFTITVEISYFEKSVQMWLHEYYQEHYSITMNQIENLKNSEAIRS